MHGEAPVVFPAHDLPGVHRHDEQAAVGQPAQSRRAVVELDDRLGATVGVDRAHGVAGHVGDPQPPVTPAGSLEEAEPARHRFPSSFAHHRKCGATRSLKRVICVSEMPPTMRRVNGTCSSSSSMPSTQAPASPVTPI